MTSTVRNRVWVRWNFARAAGAALALLIVSGLGITTPSSQAQTFTVLYSFTGSSDGGYPYAGVIRDAAGNLYGTAYSGGASHYGVVFEVTSSGTETVLYNFAGGTSDGCYPYGGVALDSSGNLYGTTSACGSSNDGVVFEVDTSGTETVLHDFAGGDKDGCYPSGGVIRDSAGSLYGTASACGSSGYGVVFEVDSSGTETVRHSFAGGTKDGAYPFYSNVLSDTKGNLYGVTEGGGPSGHGVVYALDAKGKETVLHSFNAGTADGCDPFGTPAIDATADLYGTTLNCGSANGYGTVWKVTQKKKESLLHSFGGGASDGSYPEAAVVLDPNGNLYGDTLEGGSSNLGTVFELTKAGVLTLLHSFSYSKDGAHPIGGVILDANGDLYGTSVEGGSGSYGTVWMLTP